MPKPKLFYTKLNQFHNFFNQLKVFKFITIVNILANNTFKYQIILSNLTVFLSLMLPIFSFYLVINHIILWNLKNNPNLVFST